MSEINKINLQLVTPYKPQASCSGINSIPPTVEASLYRRRQRDGRFWLGIEFGVSNAKLHARANFPDAEPHEPIWGLWDYDVSELFLSSAQDEAAVKSAPYFEFQVSPFSQHFELKIMEPRVRFDETFRSGVKVASTIKSVKAWQATLEVPLEALSCQWDRPLYGGIFACLLTDPHRAYFAAHGQTQDVPDFHRPDLFFCLAENPLSLPVREEIQ